MNPTDTVASVRLNDRYTPLVPADFRRNAGLYHRDFGTLRIYMTDEDGDGYTFRTLRFEGIGDTDTPHISAVNTLDMTLSCTAIPKVHTLRGDYCPSDGKNWFPVFQAVTSPMTFSPVGGRPSDTTAFPYFDIDTGDGTFLFSVGWSGQWLVTLTPVEGGLRVTAGLKNADFVLHAGEKVRAASVFAMYGSTPAETRRAFRRICRRDFNPLAGTRREFLPFSIQPFDRYYWNNLFGWKSDKGQILTYRNARRLEGIDTLWLDAAWFRLGFPHGVGNYSFAPGFPNGLTPISDEVHKDGGSFMVWFEPERIYEGSEIFEQHPEFLLGNGSPSTRLFNLGDEAAWTFLHDTLRRFLTENEIDVYRQDFNIEPLPYWLANDEDGRVGITEMKYVEGLYRLWDALRDDIPGLMIDNCASGGRRIDFETMRRSVPMWRSDTNGWQKLEQSHSYYNQNNTLELGEYLCYFAGAAWEPVAYRVRSAATCGLSVSFDILNDAFDYEAGKKCVTEAKRLAVYWNMDFYPMTEPSLSLDGFAAWRFGDGDRGVLYIFRRAECREEMYRFVISDATVGTYLLTLTDETFAVTTMTVTAEQLQAGISCRLPAADSSMVVEYKHV